MVDGSGTGVTPGITGTRGSPCGPPLLGLGTPGISILAPSDNKVRLTPEGSPAVALHGSESADGSDSAVPQARPDAEPPGNPAVASFSPDAKERVAPAAGASKSSSSTSVGAR
jgi:hypothetical protein